MYRAFPTRDSRTPCLSSIRKPHVKSMRQLRRVKCSVCGYEPNPNESACRVCHGKANWLWQCERHGLPAVEGLGCARCAYSFDGRTFFEPSALAAELAKQWDKALESLSS